jgi:NADPH:quinone reductase-like Zn-dependent oxidoreductase
MKAVICKKWGSPDMLLYKDMPKPVPKNKDILIKVHAATVTMGDCEFRSLKVPIYYKFFIRLVFGFRGPRRKILGQELSGEVVSVGKDVTKFSKGDEIFAHTGLRLGGYGEYACLPEKGLIAKKPTNMTFEEAATVPLGGFESLHLLRKGNIQKGHKVLINGAGGSIGTYGVQLAKYFGGKVTAVDSTKKLDMLKSIGADHVIDYTKEDFTKRDEMYDVIFDVFSRGPFSGHINSLNDGGILLTANALKSRTVREKGKSKKESKRVIGYQSDYKAEDLVYLKRLIEEGKLKSVIDRCYPLAQTADAHRYVETGQKIGNVVITVKHNNKT